MLDLDVCSFRKSNELRKTVGNTRNARQPERMSRTDEDPDLADADADAEEAEVRERDRRHMHSRL